MRQSKKSNLAKLAINIGIPIVAAGAALAISEATGLSQFLQNYQQAKAPIVRDFFGNFIGSIYQFCADNGRVLNDMVAAGMGAYLGRIFVKE